MLLEQIRQDSCPLKGIFEVHNGALMPGENYTNPSIQPTYLKRFFQRTEVTIYLCETSQSR